MVFAAITNPDTTHKIWAGYSDVNDELVEKSVPLVCEPSDQSYQCRLPCKSEDQSFQVAAKSVRWTISQGQQDNWVRVYEVIIQGTPVDPEKVESENLGEYCRHLI